MILDGNPLDAMRNTNRISYVMKDGRLYQGSSLDEVWPRKRKLELRDWIVAEPEAGVVKK